MTHSARGRVYLIGAGPGKADLITVRGAHLLRTADVVLYDRLISEETLSLIPEGVTSKCVGGDHGSDPGCKQDNINTLMLESVEKGLNVARLKIGDPFLFGRGGEEVAFLAEHGIGYEIVPGISSALGIPTFNGIPLTHREYASSVTIISGHRKAESENDWKSIIKLGSTIVILMGVGTLRNIMKRLVKEGMDKEMPVAVVENGTLNNQRIITGTISDIADSALKASIQSPAIIIVGQVVKLSTFGSRDIARITERIPWLTSQ